MTLRQQMSLRRSWDDPPTVDEDGHVRLCPRRPARVHLGCGDRYLSGYLNIDLPPEEGVASGTSRPDVIADITALRAPNDCLSEIRLHHVFEHFERARALALLIKWHSWLVPGGALVLETPDFEACIEQFNARTSAEQGVILRHLFGSQEAPWALHKDGWSASRFRQVLPSLGFESTRIERTYSDEGQLLANVVSTATKADHRITREEQIAAATDVLRSGMNGQNPTEERLLAIWRDQLLSHLA